MTHGFLDCKLMPKYLSGYAGGQKMEFKSLFDAKAKCLQGKYVFISCLFSCRRWCILNNLQIYSILFILNLFQVVKELLLSQNQRNGR